MASQPGVSQRAGVRVLGGPLLHDAAGERVALAPRGRRLLAALVLRGGRSAPVDWLAEIVWRERQPAQPPAAVHTLVSRLRRALATAGLDPAALATSTSGYTLRLPSGTRRPRSGRAGRPWRLGRCTPAAKLC